MKTLLHGTFLLLEEALIAHVRAIRAASPLDPIAVLVPNRLLRLHLQRALADAGRPHANIRFLTFRNFADQLAGNVMRTNGLVPAPRFFAELALAKIIQSHPDRLRYFGPVAEKEGFRRALLETFRDLKEAGLAPDDLEEVRAALDRPKDRSLQSKLDEILLLWSELESRHAQAGFHDDADLLAAAAEQAPRSPWLARQSRLIVYGVYDMNGLQRGLVEAVMSKKKPTVVFMPYRESPAFRYAAPLFAWFQARGFSPSSAAPRREVPRTDLDALQANLFSETAARQERRGPGRGVVLISAPGEEREAEEIVREVIHAADWAEGEPPPRTGILLRSRAPYGEILAEIAGQVGLKGCIAAGPPLSSARPARALLRLVKLADGPMKRADVMEFLTAAPLQDPQDPDRQLPLSRIALWDQIGIEAGIIEGATTWLSRLDALAARGEREPDHGDEDREGRKASADVAEVRAFRDYLASFFDRLHGIRRQETWKAMADEAGKSFDETVIADETTGNTRERLHDIGRLDKTGIPPTPTLLHSLLERALDEQNPPARNFGACEPLVADLMDARGVTFDTVILPGMVEKLFPRPPRPDPILLDAERKRLSSACERLRKPVVLPLKREAAGEEELLFALAAGSARRRLVLAWPRLDAAHGRPRIGSHFLLRCLEAVTGEPCDYEALERFVRNDSAGRFVRFSRQDPAVRDRAVGALEYDLSSLGKARRENTPDALLYCSYESLFFARALAAETARWGSPSFSEYDGVIARPRLLDGVAKALHDPAVPVSPTRLEQYAKCPFAYLIKYLLNLEAVEEPEEAATISALDRGILIHGILWEFMSKTAADGPVRPTMNDWPRLEAIARRRFAVAERTRPTGYPLLWRIEQETILEDLREFLLREASAPDSFQPAYFEVRFGMRPHDREESGESTEAPVPFDLSPGARVLFRGKIDRVDIAPDRGVARIMDYKTGKARGLKDNAFDGGRALQLPIYLVAARRLFEEIPPGEAQYYYSTRRGEWKRTRFDSKNWPKKSKTLARILRTILDGIRGGLFYARPSDKECTWCDCRAICAHGRLSEFKWNADARCRAFNDMAEIP